MFKKFKINSPTKFTVGVFGANGNVGRATVAALSYYFASSINIRAIVRDTKKGKDLANFKGVHIVSGEVGSNDCSKSLDGLACIFIIPPAVEDRIDRTKVAIKLAIDCKINHILTISVTVADDLNSQFGKEFAELENHVKTLVSSFTILRLPIFADNFWIVKYTLPKIKLMLDKDKYFTPVVIADIGVAAAFVLAQWNKHVNKIYTITSDRITMNHFVCHLSDVMNYSVNYEQISFEDTKKFMMEIGVEDWQIKGTAELSQMINEGSALLDRKDSNDFKIITNQDPTSIKDWVINAKDYFLT